MELYYSIIDQVWKELIKDHFSVQSEIGIIFDPLARKILAYLLLIIDQQKFLSSSILQEIKIDSGINLDKPSKKPIFKYDENNGENYLLMNLTRLILYGSISYYSYLAESDQKIIVNLSFFDVDKDRFYLNKYLPSKYHLNQLSSYFKIVYQDQSYLIDLDNGRDEMKMALAIASFKELNLGGENLSVEYGFQYGDIKFEETKIPFDYFFYLKYYYPPQKIDFNYYYINLFKINLKYEFVESDDILLKLLKFLSLITKIPLNLIVGPVAKKVIKSEVIRDPTLKTRPQTKEYEEIEYYQIE